MYAAPDMGPFSGAYAAGFFSLAEKSSLEKILGPFSFCCHKNTSFSLTWHIIEAFILIAGVRHRARSRTVFGSSSGGAGFSADAQQS